MPTAPNGSNVGPGGYDGVAWSAKYPNTICRLNGYDQNAVTYVPIAIIGAGESGIAMGCRLKEALGFDQFRIFERQSGAGGTWWINRYPGVACDIPAIFYSFSFSPNHKWTAFFPPGAEMLKYMHDVINKYEIADKFQVNTDVEGCKWIEADQIWEVYLRHMVAGTGDMSVKDRNAKIAQDGEQAIYLGRETIRAKIVISAVGGLVEPNALPKNVPGFETFQGEVFHSARWRYDVDMKDKDVVVVGTGCSAAQFVPRLIGEYGAKSVTQIMRSPPWVVPRPIPPGGTKWWNANSGKYLSTVPGLGYAVRNMTFWLLEYDMRLFGGEEYNAKERAKLEASLRRHMKRTVPEKYHEILNPDYGVGCKRRIFDAAWLPGLQDPNIDLTTQPLKAVHPRSVTIGPGQLFPKRAATIPSDEREIPADVIVLANGFETTTWLHPLKVIGRDGHGLSEVMEERGGPQAYQGTAMDGFPNFFALFGPNTTTGHSSVILATEGMVNYSLKFIKKVLDGDASTVEVKKEAEIRYTTEVQAALKKSVWNSGGCNSWYVSDGWNATVYPHSQVWFWFLCKFPKWSDWNIRYTTKGLIKHRLSQALRTLGLILAIVLAYRSRTSPDGLWAVPRTIRQTLKVLAETGSKALMEVAKA